MTCDLCCWRTCVEMYRIKGREVFLCPKCRMDHLDFPKLAASLEAAKGRKCLDPDCEAHATSWGRGLRSLTAELKKVIPRPGPITELPGWLEKTEKEIAAMHKRIVKSLSETMVPRVREPGDLAKAYAAAGAPADLSSVNAALALLAEPKLPQFCAHLIEAGDRCGRVMPCPTHPLPELKLCTCGHPVRDHWKDCGGCWKVIPGKTTDSGNCDCEKFTEATRLCTCGHEIGWHYPKAPTRCGWQENKGAPDCLCERFTEAIGWRKEAAATPFGREQLAHLCACGHPPVCHYESSGPCNLSTCTCGKFAEATEKDGRCSITDENGRRCVYHHSHKQVGRVCAPCSFDPFEATDANG